jgi:hypothetical protein
MNDSGRSHRILGFVVESSSSTGVIFPFGTADCTATQAGGFIST